MLSRPLQTPGSKLARLIRFLHPSINSFYFDARSIEWAREANAIRARAEKLDC